MQSEWEAGKWDEKVARMGWGHVRRKEGRKGSWEERWRVERIESGQDKSRGKREGSGGSEGRGEGAAMGRRDKVEGDE